MSLSPYDLLTLPGGEGKGGGEGGGGGGGGGGSKGRERCMTWKLSLGIFGYISLVSFSGFTSFLILFSLTCSLSLSIYLSYSLSLSLFLSLPSLPVTSEGSRWTVGNLVEVIFVVVYITA